MKDFADNISKTQLCQTLAYAMQRFYQKTGYTAYIKAHIDKTNKEFQIDIGFETKEAPPETVYDAFVKELREAEKITQNYTALNQLHKYSTIEQLKTKLEEELFKITRKHSE